MYHSIHRTVKAIAAVAAILAFVVPAASAQPGRMRMRVSAVASTHEADHLDRHLYRQVRANAQPQHSVLVDGYFREAGANPRSAQTQPVLVDDYFRDAKSANLVPASGGGFAWSAFGIDAAACLGLVLILGVALAGASLNREPSGRLKGA